MHELAAKFSQYKIENRWGRITPGKWEEKRREEKNNLARVEPIPAILMDERF